MMSPEMLNSGLLLPNHFDPVRECFCTIPAVCGDRGLAHNLLGCCWVFSRPKYPEYLVGRPDRESSSQVGPYLGLVTY